MKVEIDVSLDDLVARSKVWAIVGPRKGSGDAWIAYVPGEVACICDSFEDAACVVRESLAPKRRARKSRRP